MPNLYRIKDWDGLFETNETRKLVSLQWVPVPNKHDGFGFRRMAADDDRVELMCAWTLMLQVASRGPREARGKLIRSNGAPLDARGLAIMTGFPVSIFEKALRFFAEEEQGWLEIVDENGALQPIPGPSPGVPGVSPGSPGDHPAAAADSPGRIEWNRREGNRIPEDNNAREKPAPAVSPPDQEPDEPPPVDMGVTYIAGRPVAHADAAATWAVPYADAWRRRIRGTPAVDRIVGHIGPIRVELGDPETGKRWERYLASIEPGQERYASPKRFAEMHGSFADDAVARPRASPGRATTAGEKSIQNFHDAFAERRRRREGAVA